jgi:hypothetical protein
MKGGSLVLGGCKSDTNRLGERIPAHSTPPPDVVRLTTLAFSCERTRMNYKGQRCSVRSSAATAR